MSDLQAVVDRPGKPPSAPSARRTSPSSPSSRDAHTQSAQVEIVLAVDDWPHQKAAVNSMVDIRLEFFDEVSLDYQLLGADEQTFRVAQERVSDSSDAGYVYA